MLKNAGARGGELFEHGQDLNSQTHYNNSTNLFGTGFIFRSKNDLKAI